MLLEDIYVYISKADPRHEDMNVKMWKLTNNLRNSSSACSHASYFITTALRLKEADSPA